MKKMSEKIISILKKNGYSKALARADIDEPGIMDALKNILKNCEYMITTLDPDDDDDGEMIELYNSDRKIIKKFLE